jgi:hypothetical protein
MRDRIFPALSSLTIYERAHIERSVKRLPRNQAGRVN